MFFITGPTACGKSDIAAEVALRCDAEIIGADAFQVYEGMEKLAAWPEPELRARVPHHLIGIIPIREKFDVARYRELALAKTEEISKRGKRILIVGGTGLYIRALTHGLSDLPREDPVLRKELDTLTLEQLQARYAALDPAGMERIDRHNRRRLVRAIEVSTLAGVPFSSLRADWSGRDSNPPQASIRGVVLERDRKELYARINARVRRMFADGVAAEVRGEAGPTAAQAIGYGEILALQRGQMDAESCIVTIQQRTRQYAKRQLTWVRRGNTLSSINLTNQPQREVVDFIARQIESGGSEAGIMASR